MAMAAFFRRLFGQSRCCKPEFKLGPNFTVVKKLGDGGEGEVWLCIDEEVAQLVAVKLMRRELPAWKQVMIMREIQIQSQLAAGHPGLVEPRELLLTSSHIALVSEYVPGGSLAEYCKKHAVSEDLACYFFRQLVSVIEFCHEHRVAYRDVKLENTLLDKADPPRLKLCDFGVARKWERKDTPKMNTLVGTPGYLSPQVLDTLFKEGGGGGEEGARAGPSYDACKQDVWGCGCILTFLLIQHMPYDYDSIAARRPPGEALRMAWELEHRRKWQDATSRAEGLSAELTDLLDRIFTGDEEARIGIEGIKRHAWFNRPLPPKYGRALARFDAELAARAERYATDTAQHREGRNAAVDALLMGEAARPHRGPAGLAHRLPLLPPREPSVHALRRTSLSSKFLFSRSAAKNKPAHRCLMSAPHLSITPSP